MKLAAGMALRRRVISSADVTYTITAGVLNEGLGALRFRGLKYCMRLRVTLLFILF